MVRTQRRAWTLSLVGLLLTSPTICGADWQYTRWGMTAEQALAASKGQLGACNGQLCKGQSSDKSRALLSGNYTSGEFAFTAYLYFENSSKKLGLVKLKLKNPENANGLIGALRARYGEPVTQSRTPIMSILTWRTNVDQITVVTIGSGASALVELDYQPRITASNQGL